MDIRILPDQVPLVWDDIKHAVEKVLGYKGIELQIYLNTLLVDLLNDKAQCFVKLDNEKNLDGIALTAFIQSKVSIQRELLITCLYSYSAQDTSEWVRGFASIRKFAENTGCKRIVAQTNNPRVEMILKSLSFEPEFVYYSMDIGG